MVLLHAKPKSHVYKIENWGRWLLYINRSKQIYKSSTILLSMTQFFFSYIVLLIVGFELYVVVGCREGVSKHIFISIYYKILMHGVRDGIYVLVYCIFISVNTAFRILLV